MKEEPPISLIVALHCPGGGCDVPTHSWRRGLPSDVAGFERLVIRDTEDPEVVIGFRPGAREQFVRQVLRGTDDPEGAFETAEELDGLLGNTGDELPV